MLGNQVALNDAIAYVRSGVDVAVYGRPGSGRTTFLSRLADELRTGGANVRVVLGIPSLKNMSLAGVAELFQDPGLNPRTTGVAGFSQRLSAEAASGQFVLIVDDADQLDEASWGVIRAAQYRAGFPVVTCHLRTREVLQDATSSYLARAYRVALEPLRLDELGMLLESRGRGPVGPATLSRIFGMSGGIPGLAVGIFDVGVQEGRLENHDSGWSATSELWSATLGRLVERHVGPLPSREREALELLSLSGPLDLDSVLTLVGDEIVERLEEQAVLTFALVDGRYRSAVVPPLIAEYFRHLVLPARTKRLSRGVEGLIADRALASVPREPAGLHAPQPDAMFVRAVQDAARARLARSRADWGEEPNAEHARAYLAALGNAEISDEDVRAIIARTTNDDPLAAARLVSWHAAWLAGRGHSRQAQDLLQDAEAAAPRYRPLLQAMHVRIRVLYDGYVGDARADIDDPIGLPPEQSGSVHVIRAACELISGRVMAAEQELAAVDPHSTGEDWADFESTRGLIRLAKGEHAEATVLAYRALDRARAGLDATSIRTTAYFAALCQLIQGNYREVSALVETALAVGTPNSNSPTSLLGALCIGSIAAGRTGNPGLAQTRLEQADRLLVSHGPFPGMATTWARSQIHLSGGRAGAARQELREGAELLWRRGAKWSSVLENLIELELWPEEDRLAELRPRFDEIDGEFVAALRAYVEGLVREDPTQLEESAPRLLRTGRTGFAVNAYDRAAQYFEQQGSSVDSERSRLAGEDLVASLEPGTFDAARFRSADILLTAREIQLARLASMGWSNQQIANELVLSVRTVESHLHRIMKKTATSSRRDLSRFLAASELA